MKIENCEAGIKEITLRSQSFAFEPTSKKVADIIISRFSSGPTNLRATSRELRHSVRTLQRRLSGEGTTFAEIQDRCRFSSAVILLAETGKPMHKIASDLGFTSRCSFTTAFRRWTGMTPSKYRQALQNE